MQTQQNITTHKHMVAYSCVRVLNALRIQFVEGSEKMERTN